MNFGTSDESYRPVADEYTEARSPRHGVGRGHFIAVMRHRPNAKNSVHHLPFAMQLRVPPSVVRNLTANKYGVTVRRYLETILAASTVANSLFNRVT